MNDNIIKILDFYWMQVAGGHEHDAVLNSMSCYIKIQNFDQNNGTVSGLGLWGSKAKNWSIDFGKDYSQLEFNCECPSIRIRTNSDVRVPCSHLIRALITIESKIKSLSYEEVFNERISNIIPF